MSHTRAAVDAIPEAKRRIAERAAHDAAAKLGMPTPRVVWWKEGPSDGWVDWRAQESDGVVNILACVRASMVRGIVFHEARHLWQDITGRYFCDMARAEEDAEAWTYRQTGV